MIRAAVVTVSTRSFQGEREDTSGPLLCKLLKAIGIEIMVQQIIPDEQERIATLLVELVHRGDIDLIITTGGTGPSPSDVTPEATKSVIHKEMPGLVELIRSDGYRRTPFAVLSRAVAGIRNHTLIINLPGNPRAVREAMEVLSPILPSAIALVKGERPTDGICD